MAGNLKKLNKKSDTGEAEGILKWHLRSFDFNEAEPDLQTAWEAFKWMSDHEFDCGGDELLFETGVYDFTGKELYYLYIVRQFIIEVDGEFDYIKQVRMEFSYEPVGELKEMKDIINSSEFDDDFEKFIMAVGKRPAFLVPLVKYTPVGFDLFTEEI